MTMDYEKLKDLIDHLDASSLAYVDFKSDAEHVILSKEMPQSSQPVQTVVEPTSKTLEAPVETSNVLTEPLPVEMEEVAGEAIESPMVGVVYLQPGPDKDFFVQVGDRVEQGQTICIVEAMKLMNEIQAPKAGIVTEILVENEEVVEFGQPLIRID